MKKLEELGISPAPWKIRVGDFDVVDTNDEIVVEYQFVKPDIRIVAAAPRMYEREVRDPRGHGDRGASRVPEGCGGL